MRLIILLVIAGALFSWMCIFCHWITDKHLGYSGPHPWCFSRFIFFFLPCLHCDYSWSSSCIFSSHVCLYVNSWCSKSTCISEAVEKLQRWNGKPREQWLHYNTGLWIQLLGTFPRFSLSGPFTVYTFGLALFTGIGWRF